MLARKLATLALLVSCGSVAVPRPELHKRYVFAESEAGWLCGTIQIAKGDQPYASFRGVPYAKQPLGELRFKELQPLERWSGYYNATTEGPVCPQYDVVYGRMMQPQGMNEACIHANIHVPLEFLPLNQNRQMHWSAFQDWDRLEDKKTGTGLPIVVFIHGGGFNYGSGDSDVYGPEYLVSRKVIVITFNYRLNVMGFLSLKSSSIPGNNGLRDMVTMLRWVQRNAQAFGGNPDDVTLAGQSAGAACAHLLSLSPGTEGLFKRVWLMSGVGTAGFYSSSPVYAQVIANLFLTTIGINSTDPEEIHRQLVDTPIEKIVETNKALQDLTGLITFAPVIEAPLPGVTPMIDDDPEVLVAKGRGKHIPLVIGFTNKECEVFRRRFEQVDIISQIKSNPTLVVSPQLIYTTLPTDLPGIATLIHEKYFNGTVNMVNFLNLCSDQYFIYPAMKLATMRSETSGAPVYLYQFAYDNEHNVLREALRLSYKGAAHIEDMTYVFRVNSILNKESRYRHVPDENNIIDRMTTFFTNFMKTSNPVAAEDIYSWLPVDKDTELMYQNIEWPETFDYTNLTKQQRKAMAFFDSIHDNERTA